MGSSTDSRNTSSSFYCANNPFIILHSFGKREKGKGVNDRKPSIAKVKQRKDGHKVIEYEGEIESSSPSFPFVP